MPSESWMGDEGGKKRFKIISLSSDHFPTRNRKVVYMWVLALLCYMCKRKDNFYQNFNIRSVFVKRFRIKKNWVYACRGNRKKTLEHFYQNFNIRSVFVKTLSDKEKIEYICVCAGEIEKKNFGEIEYIYIVKVCLFSHKKLYIYLFYI